MYSPAFIFICGFLSGVLATIIAALQISAWDKAKPKVPRRWSTIKSFRYVWNFEYHFRDEFTMRDLSKILPRMMIRLNRTKPIAPDVTIDAGNYTVDLTLFARFVEREKQQQK